MSETISNEAIEQAAENIIESITTIDQLPTDDFVTFHEGFYGGDDVAADMFTLVQAFGLPLPNRGEDKILWRNRDRMHVQSKPAGGKFRFSAISSVIHYDDCDTQTVYLEASTKVVPLLTRQRSIWGIKLGLRDVYKPSQTPFIDEAYSARYRIGKQTVGIVATPNLLRNSERLHTSSDQSSPYWMGYAEPAPIVTSRTADGIPILPSSEINRDLQLFVDNFCALNLLLLASTSTPIALEFVKSKEQNNGLTLIPPIVD